jgi:hypothetical protein
MMPLPTTRAAQLAPAPYTAQDWLIEGLWSASGGLRCDLLTQPSE